ncbi:FAD-dependent monooxygenase [Nocardia sp. NEAU-G5]|uniref:FAD-dependent monooxygenase n=1 Tax=Nocardia albiluteola TaxID=2842303 RepID=A0ABS6B8T9_9NOCA|nr:NAD(P)/FAD-dependent oxidoreductase [Nocardia albiluteola]MBU3066712.1 FAD-dependent monooxygenase [Nocardia albiluteola]
MRVMIIGGGTGGMCLAHGLKRAGVEVVVYERYGSRRDGLYGYRVGIDPTGNRALQECLPADLFDTFVATCARGPRYFNVLTQSKHATASIPLRDDSDEINSERSVSRSTLRQVLFTGMDDVVRFGKEFTHYEQHENGTVTAHFSDGTSDTGDVLIAADGTRSAVRRQFLPHAEIKDAGITSIATKTALTPEVRALLTEEMRNGINLVFATKGLIGMLHVMEFKWDAEGNPKNPADAALLESWNGLQFDNARDYVNLSVWSSHDHFPAGTVDQRGTELIATALEVTRNWHPDLRRIFELSDPEAAFPLQISTSVPVEPWKTTNITLLGDAIHTMTPGQGVGANTALRDAALLCRELVAAANGEKSLLTAIADYEADMLPYGFARVADSLDNNGTSGDDPLYQPYTGRLALFAARTFFSLTAKIPALRRKFLEDLYTYRGAEDAA